MRRCLGGITTALSAVAACTSPSQLTAPDAPGSDVAPIATKEMYAWNGSAMICSQALDDLEGVTRDWALEQASFAAAQQRGTVTIAHVHQPGVTVSTDAIERVLDWADQYHLDYVTFDELSPDQPHRAGLAFAFDDDDVSGWMSVRDILLAHRARVTFFVTRWQDLSAADRANLATLAGDGHDIEAHSVTHQDATAQVASLGLAGYISAEVVPSYQVLVDAGFHPTSYAYPFGDHDPAIDAAVLAVPGIVRVRTTGGGCDGSSSGGAE
jgi:hypothetical protein